MAPKNVKKPVEKTDDGVSIGGGVNTGGGDFVGRDKTISADNGGVAVGGSVTGSTIVTGSGNNVTNAHNAFVPVYRAIEESARPPEQKADLKADATEIEAEVAKGDKADESFLARRLRSLVAMAPDIAEVVMAALAGPGAAVAAIVKKVAEKVKSETKTA